MSGAGLITRSRYVQWVLVSVFPRLRAWPVRDWPDVLAKARATESDAIERYGVIASVVLVTWLLRPPPGLDVPMPLLLLTQMTLAIPALVALTGPFYLRRIRRGLQAVHQQDHPTSEAPDRSGQQKGP